MISNFHSSVWSPWVYKKIVWFEEGDEGDGCSAIVWTNSNMKRVSHHITTMVGEELSKETVFDMVSLTSLFFVLLYTLNWVAYDHETL